MFSTQTKKIVDTLINTWGTAQTQPIRMLKRSFKVQNRKFPLNVTTLT